MAAKTRWTDDQLRAIETRGRNILVSAAAGSGKTAVLTERAVRRMLDPKAPVDADRFMVVTFTKASAMEMKQRMLQKLSDKIAEQPLDAAAKRQRQLLERSSTIGTIDSLCYALVKENWQKLGLPAAFRLGDADETDFVRAEAVNAVLENAYKAPTHEFLELSELLSQGGGDGGLASAVLRVYDFARTHPFYRDWIGQKLAVYADFADPVESMWGRVLREYAIDALRLRLKETSRAVKRLQAEPEFANYLPAFCSDAALLSDVLSALEKKQWDEAVALLRGHSFAALKAVRGVDADRKKQLSDFRKATKELVSTLSENVLASDTTEFRRDVAELYPKLKCLFDLVLALDDELGAQKRDSGVFEFTDITQFAVELLAQRSEGGYRPTALARELQARYDEIMVDEYQDVNAVQDMIITSLSNGRNLFMVGDVKQSIYRFRQARPEIFLARGEKYRLSPDENEAFVTLLGNFRSRREITDAINLIFAPLFSKSVGDLVYDETHRLEALASYPPVEGAGVSLCLLEKGALTADAAAAAEAGYVAKKIRDMLDSKVQVCENGAMRPVEPGDIAILLRSAKTHGEAFVKALEAHGISSYIKTENGFITSPEITAVMNLLKAVANPTRDIELIGAMLSPMLDFCDDELAKMRVKTPSGHMWQAVRAYADTDAHAAKFLELFESLRHDSLTTDTAALIARAIEKTGFDMKCRAADKSGRSFSNLLLLEQYAGEYHEKGSRGLSAFLSAIERMERQGGDKPPAYVGESRGAVFVTTIHNSKGLEWPVVFLSEAGRAHNQRDLAGETILHSEMGFACIRKDRDLRLKYTTAPLDAVRLAAGRDMLSEELRLFYVAATRARERLIITAAVKNALKAAEESRCDDAAPDPVRVRGCKSYAQWMLLSLGCAGDVHEQLLSGGGIGQIALRYAELDAQNGENPAETAVASEEKPLCAPDPAAVSTLKERIEFRYPFYDSALLPAKLSVSEITHGQNDEYRFAACPSFIDNSASSGSLRGTAIHAFMQFCDYKSAGDNVKAELERMVSAGILTAAQGALVDTAVIESFFKSTLAKRIFSADEVLREFAFMVSAEKCPYTKKLVSASGEAPMLQGIADCIIIENGRALLIDYKTDRVKDAQTLKDRYSAQLSLYREMLSVVLPYPVEKCVIWSFALDTEIAL